MCNTIRTHSTPLAFHIITRIWCTNSFIIKHFTLIRMINRQVWHGHPRGGICRAQDPSWVLGRRGFCQGEVHHTRKQGSIPDAGTLRFARWSSKVARKRKKRRGYQRMVYASFRSGASDQFQTTDSHHAYPGELSHIMTYIHDKSPRHNNDVPLLHNNALSFLLLSIMDDTQYMRVAFQIPFDATVRVSLDTNLTMISERTKETLIGERWYRDPEKAVPLNEITR